MKPDYRYQARQSLKRGKTLLSTNESPDLKYAALELRSSMEYLTYDRAYAYRKEIPDSEYDKWQPRKLMALLLEIDSMADKGCSIAVAPEITPGVVDPDANFTSLGTDHVLDLKALKKHYDALGSYLHAPTIAQIKSPKKNHEEKLRVRCDELVEIVENALSSTVFNVTLGEFSSVECERCGAIIRRRLAFQEPTTTAECFGCGAPYQIAREENNAILWKALQSEVPCTNKDCDLKLFFWHDQIKPDKYWICKSCKRANQFAIGVIPKPD